MFKIVILSNPFVYQNDQAGQRTFIDFHKTKMFHADPCIFYFLRMINQVRSKYND